jgi:hypothetical protein
LLHGLQGGLVRFQLATAAGTFRFHLNSTGGFFLQIMSDRWGLPKITPGVYWSRGLIGDPIRQTVSLSFVGIFGLSDFKLGLQVCGLEGFKTDEL